MPKSYVFSGRPILLALCVPSFFFWSTICTLLTEQQLNWTLSPFRLTALGGPEAFLLLAWKKNNFVSTKKRKKNNFLLKLSIHLSVTILTEYKKSFKIGLIINNNSYFFFLSFYANNKIIILFSIFIFFWQILSSYFSFFLSTLHIFP